MEPLKNSTNVTRLPGAEDVRLREPPHNFEAEQALLGAILVNNAAYQRVAEFLRPEHFADPLHGKLFDSLSRLIERGQVVSAVTLKTYVEQDEDDEVGRRRAPTSPAWPRLRCMSSTPARSAGRCTISTCAGSSSISARSVVNGAFGSDVDETALQQIEIAEKKLYDLASAGQTEGGFKPFRAALTEATVAAEAAYHRAGQLTGVAIGPVPARPAAGRPAQVGPHHPGRPSLDGKDGARHQHRLQCRQGLSRGARRGRQAQGRRRRRGRLLLARNVGRAARHPHARRAGRDPVGKDPQGRADQRATSTRCCRSARARASEFLHRRHAGALHRRAAHPRAPAEAHARARAAGRRLSPAPQSLGQDRARKTACRRSPRSRAASRRWPRSSTCRCWRCRSSAAPSSSARTSGRSSPTCASRARSSRTPTSSCSSIARSTISSASEPTRRADESDQRFNERHDAWKQRCEQTYGKAEVIVAKQRHGPTGIVRLAFEGQFTKFDNLPADEERPGGPAF